MKMQIKGKQNSSPLGTGLRDNGKKLKKGITNGYEETLVGEAYFNYLDCGYVFMGI